MPRLLAEEQIVGCLSEALLDRCAICQSPVRRQSHCTRCTLLLSVRQRTHESSGAFLSVSRELVLREAVGQRLLDCVRGDKPLFAVSDMRGADAGVGSSEGYANLPDRELRLMGIRLFDEYREGHLRSNALRARLAGFQVRYLSLTDLRTLVASAGSLIAPASTPPRAKG